MSTSNVLGISPELWALIGSALADTLYMVALAGGVGYVAWRAARTKDEKAEDALAKTALDAPANPAGGGGAEGVLRHQPAQPVHGPDQPAGRAHPPAPPVGARPGWSVP